MTALRVGVSDREPVTIFNNPPARRRFSQVEIDLQEAIRLADYGWREYLRNVDTWTENQEYELVDKAGEACEALDAKVELLIKQLHCQHENAYETGSIRMVGGDLIDDTSETCPDCGLENIGRNK